MTHWLEWKPGVCQLTFIFFKCAIKTTFTRGLDHKWALVDNKLRNTALQHGRPHTKLQTSGISVVLWLLATICHLVFIPYFLKQRKKCSGKSLLSHFEACLQCSVSVVKVYHMWNISIISFLSQNSLVLCVDTMTSSQDPPSRDSDSPAGPLTLLPQKHSPCILPEPSPAEDTHCTGSLVSDSSASSRVLAHDTSSGPSPASSPEIVMDHILESLDSEPEQDGIFLDFTRRSVGSAHSRDSNRQSVA